MKATAKDVKWLQVWGQEDEVVSKLIENRTQPDIFPTAWYSPSTANWSWTIGIAKIGRSYYELLTRFGAVEGGRRIHLPEYNMNLLNKRGL